MAERPQKFPKPRTKIFMHTNWEIFMQKDSSHVKESYMKFLDFAPKGNRVTTYSITHTYLFELRAPLFQ